MAKKKFHYHVYVDGSFKNQKGGIGIYIERNTRFFQQRNIKIPSCKSPHEVEILALIKGVEVITGRTSNKNITVFSDCLNAVKELNGELNGIRIEWIPRELNMAHEMSIKGRMSLRERKKYNKTQLEKYLLKNFPNDENK